MKQIQIIILTIFIWIYPLQSKSKESGVLYLWEMFDEKVWKRFGDDETQQKYNGEIKYGQPHGLGIINFLDGTKYIGQWKDGMQHGQGSLIFTDGTKLAGEWKQNKEWNIKKISTNGRIYDEYIHGIKQINNKKDGVLFFREDKGSFGWYEKGNEKKDYKYSGEIENEKPNGWGKLIYPSGYTYQGQFKEGKAHGKGSFLFPDGKKSIGLFRENKPWNITEFDNNSKIIAEYINGVLKVEKKQTGILFTRKDEETWIWFKNGDIPYSGRYEGQIEDEKPNGQGSITFLNGTKYIGQYKNGTWDGQGIFYFPGGDKWVGEFKNDAPWNINWYDKTGKIISKWENGIKKFPPEN